MFLRVRSTEASIRSPGRLSGAQQSQGCNLQGRPMHVSVHTHTRKREHEKKVRINVDLTTEKDVIVGLWAKSWNIYFHLWEICRSFFFFFEGAYEWVKATSSATGNTVTELSLRVQKTSTLSSQSPNSGQGGISSFISAHSSCCWQLWRPFGLGSSLKCRYHGGFPLFSPFLSPHYMTLVSFRTQCAVPAQIFPAPSVDVTQMLGLGH